MPSSYRHAEGQLRARIDKRPLGLMTIAAIAGVLVVTRVRRSPARSHVRVDERDRLRRGEDRHDRRRRRDGLLPVLGGRRRGRAGAVEGGRVEHPGLRAAPRSERRRGRRRRVRTAGTLTLPATGTYTVRLFDHANDETGGYAVQMQVLSATGSSCPAARLPCGGTRAGFLASIVQSDTYRVVAAEAGEVVSITTADTSSPFEACWQVYAADGSAVGTPACGQATRTLPAAGPYTIRVSDLANDDTGTYRRRNVVSATAGGCPDATLVCGGTHPDTITAIGENDVYWFTTTTPNEVVTIATATTAGSLNTCWQLYDAAGTSTGSIICGQEKRVPATPETYVLRVFDLTYENAGGYDVTAEVSPACPVTPTPTATPTPSVTPTAARSAGPTPGDTSAAGTATPDAAAAPRRRMDRRPRARRRPEAAGPPGRAGPVRRDATGSGGADGWSREPHAQGTRTVQELEAILDDFLCYGAKLTRGSPKFAPARGLRMTDALDGTAFDVKKPIALCAPADKDGNGIGDADTSLERYRIRSATVARRASSKPRGGSRRRSARCRSTCSGPISCSSRPRRRRRPAHRARYDRRRRLQVLPGAHHAKDAEAALRSASEADRHALEPSRRFKAKSPSRLCVATGEDLPGAQSRGAPALLRGEAHPRRAEAHQATRPLPRERPRRDAGRHRARVGALPAGGVRAVDPRRRTSTSRPVGRDGLEPSTRRSSPRSSPTSGANRGARPDARRGRPRRPTGSNSPDVLTPTADGRPTL